MLSSAAADPLFDFNFNLLLDPPTAISFSGNGRESASTNVKITNPLEKRVAVKIKCTSNDMFKIHGAVFALNPGESVTKKLTFLKPDFSFSGRHFFRIRYIFAEDVDKTPRQTYADHEGPPEGAKVIFVYFEDEEADLVYAMEDFLNEKD